MTKYRERRNVYENFSFKKSLAIGFVVTGMTALASTTIHAEDIQPATNAMDTTTTTAETSDSTEVQKTTSEKLADAQSELNQTKENESSAQKDYNNKQTTAN